MGHNSAAELRTYKHLKNASRVDFFSFAHLSDNTYSHAHCHLSADSFGELGDISVTSSDQVSQFRPKKRHGYADCDRKTTKFTA
jgi:hypothetical protein